jgi:hypothetical protein
MIFVIPTNNHKREEKSALVARKEIDLVKRQALSITPEERKSPAQP